MVAECDLEAVRSKGMFDVGDRDAEPAIALNPDDVTTYKVKRTYSGVKAPHWYSARRP